MNFIAHSSEITKVFYFYTTSHSKNYDITRCITIYGITDLLQQGQKITGMKLIFLLLTLIETLNIYDSLICSKIVLIPNKINHLWLKC